MIKKLLICAVCIAMLLTLLAGCKVKPKDSDDSPSLAPRPTTTAEPIKTEPTAEPAPEEAETEKPSDFSVPARGKWTDDVYINEFAGISFKLPEGWSVYTDDQIAGMLGITEDILNDEEKWVIEASKLTTIYDMMAIDPLIGSNIIVIYENLANSFQTTDITAEEYFEIAKSSLESIDTFSYVIGEASVAEVCGQTFSTLQVSEETAGFSQHYYIRRQNDYMVGFIITLMSDDDITEFMKNFQ